MFYSLLCVCVCVCVCVGGWVVGGWVGNCAAVTLLAVQTCVSKVADKLFGCMYLIIAYVLDLRSQYVSKMNTSTILSWIHIQTMNKLHQLLLLYGWKSLIGFTNHSDLDRLQDFYRISN